MKQSASILAVGLVLASGCANQSAPNPVVIGAELGRLTCLVARTEVPATGPAIAAAVTKALDVVDAPSPTLRALHEVLAAIDEPKAQLYVSAVVSSALVLYPDLANIDQQLSPDAIAALRAALTACRGVIAPTTTTL